MDIALQALVMGIVQGLTEFLPISSSGHLILVPYLLGWTDPFINSLAFSVMLHMGTLAALLAYFWRDWARLVPAGLAAVRDRSFRGDRGPPARLAARLRPFRPAIVLGVLLSDFFEEKVRQPILVGDARRRRRDPVAGRPPGSQERTGSTGSASRWRVRSSAVRRRSPWSPGSAGPASRSAPGCALGLTREAAARFSFLMATPVIAGAGLFEAPQARGGGGHGDVNTAAARRRHRGGRHLRPGRHPRPAAASCGTTR
jgi:undecaprenyl-diphosphatase